MRISRKYPVFLLFTTMGTAFAVSLAMREVLRTSLEKEVIKRGEASAEAFASINAPTLLALHGQEEMARLRYNLAALGENPDVVNARVADTQGKVVISLNAADTGTALPAFLRSNDAASHYVDESQNVYHFRAPMRYGRMTAGTFVLTLSRTPLDAPLRAASRQALVFAAGIATLMSIFGLLLVRREVRPLKEMNAALALIAGGDFSQRVPVRRQDEIGELADAFNNMLKRAELFFQYNDKMVIERLIADESLAQPGGRLRDLAVVFGDMRGYTAMSNRRNADQVVRIVNTYFHLFIECIAHWGGVLDKTMGDAIMAVFERPDGDAIDSHKRRALLATCYMKATSGVLNRFLYNRRALGEELDLEPREFGFAMATGRAIVGNIGSTRRMDYTVCGRVVNLASRLEGLTKSGEVIIDNFSLKGTSDLIVFETLPAVQPKGYGPSEKVIPRRIITLSDEESHRLRIFLKKVFTYSFVKDKLMPTHMGTGEEQAWCKEAEITLLRIIAETPIPEFFLRVDTETGKALEGVSANLSHGIL